MRASTLLALGHLRPLGLRFIHRAVPSTAPPPLRSPVLFHLPGPRGPWGRHRGLHCAQDPPEGHSLGTCWIDDHREC